MPLTPLRSTNSIMNAKVIAKSFMLKEGASYEGQVYLGGVKDEAKDEVYNVAVGDRTTLNSLFSAIKNALIENGIDVKNAPIYRDFRIGDVRHSQADISKAKKALDYQPQFVIAKGIDKAMPWYKSFLSN